MKNNVLRKLLPVMLTITLTAGIAPVSYAAAEEPVQQTEDVEEEPVQDLENTDIGEVVSDEEEQSGEKEEMQGPDHKASVNPDELCTMVSCIRNIEDALGDKHKCITDSETENKYVARKSIVALRNIKKGELLTEDNLTTKRPGTGISPMKWHDIIGTIAVKDFNEDELIEI